MQLYKMQVNQTAVFGIAPVRVPKGIIGAVVKLSFSAEWEGLTKTAVFRAGEVTKDVADIQDAVVIPAECTREAGVLLEIGIYGVDEEGSVAIPTLWASIGRITEAADPSGDETTDPSLPVWAQVLAMVKQLEEQGVTQNEVEQAVKDFFGGYVPAGGRTAQGGEIFNFYTDPVYTGDNPPKEYPGNTAAKGSHAEGFGTQAEGQYSHAEGWVSTASGGIAHAEGKEAEASGYASHAEGIKTVSSGRSSHAEGNESQAIGESSHAEGHKTEASGLYAHSQGYQTKATGTISHAQGRETEATMDSAHAEGRKTHATGNYAHAEGNETTASGAASHAEGYKTTASAGYTHAEGELSAASGQGAHAEGYNTTASGNYSHTEGRDTEASEYASHAEGRGTIAAARNQHVQGAFNVPDTVDAGGNGNYAHIVGGGTSDTNRKNIYTLDWEGNAHFAGKVYSGGVEVAPGGLVKNVLHIDSATDADLMAAIDGIYAQMANNTVGFVSVGCGGSGHPDLGGAAYLFMLYRRTADYGVLTAVTYDANSREVFRSRNAGVWGEWEWVNPPMALNTSYRTTKRWMGKAVYQKLVYFGALPNGNGASAAGNREVDVGVADSAVVSLTGCAKKDGEFNTIPIGMAGALGAYAYIAGTNLGVTSISQLSDYEAYFLLEYVTE